MILSILSFGTLLDFALAMQSRNLKLLFGSAPPSLTATDNSLPILVNILAREC